jgi:hypothetical protein
MMWQKNVALGLVIITLGCTTIKPVQAPVPFIAMNRPSAVLITGPNGEEIEVAGPRLQSDSLVGLFENEIYKISLLEVKQLRAKQVDRKKTTLFIAALAVGAAGAITGIAMSQGRHTVPLDTNYKCPNQLCSVSPKKATTVTIRLPFLRLP